MRLCEIVVTGDKADVYPRSLDVVASNRGMSLTLLKRGGGELDVEVPLHWKQPEFQ